MSESDSKLVEHLLARPDVHKKWESGYRTRENEAFYEQAFDYIVETLKPPPGAEFLDVGCGSCAHSVRLASRGFKVRAVDFSESALKMAEAYVKVRGFEKRIKLQRESLLELSFADESFSYVLCWGVLMHVPEVERAISELARVLKPGGFLVVSEGNMSSLEAVGIRALKRLLGKERAEVKETPAGMEYWKIEGDDALVTRQANISWLIRSFEAHSLTLNARVAGQFSEAYAMTSAPTLKKLIHGLNALWFRHVRLPRPAYGNLLLLQKRT